MQKWLPNSRSILWCQNTKIKKQWKLYLWLPKLMDSFPFTFFLSQEAVGLSNLHNCDQKCLVDTCMCSCTVCPHRWHPLNKGCVRSHLGQEFPCKSEPDQRFQDQTNEPETWNLKLQWRMKTLGTNRTSLESLNNVSDLVLYNIDIDCLRKFSKQPGTPVRIELTTADFIV